MLELSRTSWYVIHFKGGRKPPTGVWACGINEAFSKLDIIPERGDSIVNRFGNRFKFDGLDFEPAKRLSKWRSPWST